MVSFLLSNHKTATYMTGLAMKKKALRQLVATGISNFLDNLGAGRRERERPWERGCFLDWVHFRFQNNSIISAERASVRVSRLLIVPSGSGDEKEFTQYPVSLKWETKSNYETTRRYRQSKNTQNLIFTMILFNTEIFYSLLGPFLNGTAITYSEFHYLLMINLQGIKI